MDLKPAHLKRYASVTRLILKYGRSTPDTSLTEAETEPAPDDQEKGEELAKDLEALGPTFIKLGQLLSSRSTLIPPAFSTVLERLQDSVEPFPYEEVERPSRPWPWPRVGNRSTSGNSAGGSPTWSPSTPEPIWWTFG